MFATPIAAGNAVRLTLKAPAGTSRTRVLRKAADDFAGEFDSSAVVVHDGRDARIDAVDTLGLLNGTTYFYRAYHLAGGTWSSASTVSATPAAIYEDQSADAMSLVRDRLESGLAIEVVRGTLAHETGRIPVLTAPPLFEDTRWPMVSIHLQSEAPGVRGIGEVIDPDELDDEEDESISSEGWLAKVVLTIIAWSLNPDERIELRKALRRIVVANLPVFDAAGLIEIEFSQQDIEDFGSYNAPVYQSMCTFTCLAPIVVAERTPVITDVTVTVEASNGQ